MKLAVLFRGPRRAAVLVLFAAAALHAQMPAQVLLLKLIPMPREMRPVEPLPIPNGVRILPASDVDDQFASSDFAQTLASRGIHASIGNTGTASFTVELLRVSDAAAQPRLTAANLTFDPSMQAEGYVLITVGNAVTIIAASPEGIFYGLQTLKQMITFNGALAMLNGANIRDWPAMRYRGIQDDLARGPVPTLEFQKHQIQTFAAYKINVYSPYFENTLAYSSSPLAAPPGGTITADDVAQLVAFARPYHVTIVPEQESFAHLHHLLTWEQYQPLAETPHGDVLAPGQPGSLALITSWFNELAAEFPGPFLHIGADETVELGLGQTQDDVTARGLGPVYLDFVQKIDAALAPLHRRLLFWGDIAMKDPQLLAALPPDVKQNLVAVAWQYNPEDKGYARFLTPFTGAGMETWVAPGVNNWRRVYPNYGMALANIQGFTRDGQAAGSTGQLNTVWNDDGEGLFNSDWYGVLFGAAAAWQPGESSIPQFQESYGLVFHGDPTGNLDEAQRELILAHTLLKETAKAGDASNGLFWMDPWSKDGLDYAGKLRPYTHDLRMHAERALTLIAQARAAATASGVPLRETDAIDALELGARRMDFIGLKFQLADEMTAEYAQAYAEQDDKTRRPEVLDALNEIGGINGRMQDLRDGYTLLGELYAQAWVRSNRPYWLRNVAALYTLRTQLWITRADQFRSAMRQWEDTHTLPPASEIGLGSASGGTTPASSSTEEPATAVAPPAPPPCKHVKHHKPKCAPAH
ncbi:MAG TPA: glycoside hydrolase family 20 zincin-like fold domain-containing protein [Acidobacteriaceae bacterium]|jgi:hexosaminidase|nr:glycoside hydrolase family 20 zincin-like fold domain-containing protein [Acidobacteriaceae bacterium]